MSVVDLGPNPRTGADVWRRWRSRRAESDLGWRDVDFLVIDFETTGLHPRRDRPLSVGWVPVRGGRVLLGAAGYRRIRPEGEVPTESMGFHGLLPEDLADASSAADVGAALREVLDGHLLVAHAASIEVAMLAQCGVDVARAEVIDTIGLLIGLDRLEGRQTAGNLSLGAATARLGLPVHRAHHAFGDALTTAGLFLALATGFERHGAATRRDLVRHSRSRLHSR